MIPAPRRRSWWWLPLLLLAAGAVALGLLGGGADQVADWGRQLCTACIGLG